MVAYLDIIYNRPQSDIYGSDGYGGDNVTERNAPDASSWITNIAYDYQQYSGGTPVVSSGGSTTAAPSSGGTSTFWNILNGISGAIDGVRGAAGGYTQGQYNPPLNPNTPYYNQYGVPYNPGAPGTTPGPTSGFVSPGIIPGVSDTTLLIGLAVLAGVFILARK